MQDIRIDSTAPVSKLIKQVQVQTNIIPDNPNSALKADGKRKRLEKNQCIEINRGGRNIKIHAIVDALEKPIHVQLSYGDIYDSITAVDVLNQIDLKPDETTVLDDKAYGSYDLRSISLIGRRISVLLKMQILLILGTGTGPYTWNDIWWNVFNKLKENRWIATRFDKLVSCFHAFIHLGCIRIQLA